MFDDRIVHESHDYYKILDVLLTSLGCVVGSDMLYIYVDIILLVRQ